MKRLALAAVGAAVAGMTACSHVVPSAAPTSRPAVTTSPAVTSSPAATHSVAPADCKRLYDTWKQGAGKELVAELNAISSAETAGNVHVLVTALKRAEPVLTRASRYPLPACADPKAYWTVLLMHVTAAAASIRSAASVQAVMKSVPQLTRELNAELKRTEG